MKEIEREIEKVKRGAEERLNEDNMLKSKTAQDCHLRL